MLAWNWERSELPTLMFVHGFGAHCHWWSFLAPFYIERYRVVALDLPGMGDSQPPAAYHDDCFALAIIGCIEKNHLDPVHIVGHSFGGAQSLRAMAKAPHLFSRGVIVDSNIGLPPEPPIRRLQPKGKHKLSQSQVECESRFRLVPSQHNWIPALTEYIAFHSCTQNKEGWHWKSDPDCINVGELEDPELLQSVPTKIDMIYGEQSFLNIKNKPARVFSHFAQPGKLLIIPGAGHHIMVDRPLELVAAIDSLL